MQINLTDAERTFADSPEGRHAIAKAANEHHLREAHKGSGAQPWTDAMADNAARVAAAAAARSTLAFAASAGPNAQALADARVLRDSAAVARTEAMRTAYQRRPA